MMLSSRLVSQTKQLGRSCRPKRLHQLHATANSSSVNSTTRISARAHGPLPYSSGAAGTTRTASSVIVLAAGLALTKKSTTWCNATTSDVLLNSWQGTSPSSLQQRSTTKEHSPLDLIIPSLQALLRILRLLQTTGLIVLDYEMCKWQQKAIQLVQRYTPGGRDDARSFSNTGEEIDLSKLSAKELQQYWEHQVKQRHSAFEQAQIAYATSLTKQEEEAILAAGEMTIEVYKQQQKQAMKEAAEAWVQAEDELNQVGGSRMSQIHAHAAQRLVRLCRTNAGVYIKIGQHVGNMDYLIPQEYIDGLSCLLDDAPTSEYDTVCRVVQEDLGALPEELFDGFESEPIASASLAQVHVAYDKETGRKLAIKVQHQGLRETCRGDLLALTTVVHALEFFLEDFNFGWIADEIAPQLPLELDFRNEGRNAERAAACLQNRHKKSDYDVVIPKVLWPHTTSRVLCMEFEEGFRATNVEAIRKANLNPRDVAQLIARVFHSQTFLDAWVHCDPHPANVLLRASPKTGKPQMVLVDHGLYKQLDDDFRITYAQLWKALMMADIPNIQIACRALGVDGKLYTLLSGLLTARPFDEVVERSKTGSFDLSAKSKDNLKSQQDKAVIRGYAQKFLIDILTMIDQLPRQMVLLLKMNDCLRHIDYALGSPTNNLVVAGRLAAQAVYENKLGAAHLSRWERIQTWWDYVVVLWRIQIYDLGAWWMDRRRSKSFSQ